MSNSTPILPTPHLDKLVALSRNRRLPDTDRSRIEGALERYNEWTGQLLATQVARKETIQQLVDATNRYKEFIELEFIFDSDADFLYRQKGQLKLDNSILEEFLPHLFYKGLELSDSMLGLGPRSTFAGLSFMSTITNIGVGGQPTIRKKDQDFTLSKRLYVMTSFDPDFNTAERLESDLGHVCVECKTNLDKTMFQEAVATSRDLKMAVPASLYFVVCEFLDMTPVSIVSTHIDDVFVLRKAKRMPANVRQRYRGAAERRRHRDEYLEFLSNSRYHADVFERMVSKVQNAMSGGSPTVDSVLKRGYF